MTVYRDNIHGSIEIEPYAMLIINTPHFTRLRYLSQLGSTRYVYSSATHSRYEHSIGVYHLTRVLLDVIYSPRKRCHQRLRQLVCIAALCHDLGHGPFSHLFDLLLKDHYPSAPMHESRSCVIFRDLLGYIKDNHPKEYQQHLNLDASEIESICSLILGDIPNNEDFKKREYLCRIVSNSVCGIDTDRLDYLLRDSKALGLGITIDLMELIKSVTLRSIKPKPTDATGDHHHQSRCVICYPTRSSFEISQIFHTRYSLFKTAYNSPATLSVDALLKDILTAAADAGFVDLSRIVEDPLEINKLDDRVIYSIRQSLDRLPVSDHKDLRDLLRRLDVNDFYMVLFSHSFPADTHQHPLGDPSVSRSQKIEFVRYLLSTVMSDKDICSDIIIDACNLHHGKKAANPNLYVPYYNGDFTNITDELMAELFPTLPVSMSTVQNNVVLKPTSAGSQCTDSGKQNGYQSNPSLNNDIIDAGLLIIEQNFNVDQRTQDLIELSDSGPNTLSPLRISDHNPMYSNSNFSASGVASINELISGYLIASKKADAENGSLETEERSSKRSYKDHGMLSVSSFQETMINIYLRPSKYSPGFPTLSEKYLRQIMKAFIRYMQVYKLWFNILAAIPNDYTLLFTGPQELQLEKKINYHLTGDRPESTPPATKESIKHPFSSTSSLDDSDELDGDMAEPQIKYRKV